MPDKLAEMGQILEKIHRHLALKHATRVQHFSAASENGATVDLSKSDDGVQLAPAIVVMGDHGMAEGGGHGGSSDPEVLVPFVLISASVPERVVPVGNHEVESRYGTFTRHLR